MALEEIDLNDLTVADLRSLLELDPNIWDDLVKASQQEETTAQNFCKKVKEQNFSFVDFRLAIQNFVLRYHNKLH